jgi:hypothetical protein
MFEEKRNLGKIVEGTFFFFFFFFLLKKTSDCNENNLIELNSVQSALTSCHSPYELFENVKLSNFASDDGFLSKVEYKKVQWSLQLNFFLLALIMKVKNIDN